MKVDKIVSHLDVTPPISNSQGDDNQSQSVRNNIGTSEESDSNEGNSEGDDNCAVCQGASSTSKNPIVFCDGKECDIPVHKRCVGLKSIPPGDEKWFCDRCADKIPVEETDAICCSDITGCFVRTNHPKKFIHVECAYFNPEINSQEKPIQVDLSLVGKHECCLCKKNSGICLRCFFKETPEDESTRCQNFFHATCIFQKSTPSQAVPPQSGLPIFCPHHNRKKSSEPLSTRLLKRKLDSQRNKRNLKKRLLSRSPLHLTRQGDEIMGSSKKRSTRPTKILGISSEDSDEGSSNFSDEYESNQKQRVDKVYPNSGKTKTEKGNLVGNEDKKERTPQSLSTPSSINSDNGRRSSITVRKGSIRSLQVDFSGLVHSPKRDREKLNEIQKTLSEIKSSQNRFEQYIKGLQAKPPENLKPSSLSRNSIIPKLKPISSIDASIKTFDITAHLDIISGNKPTVSKQPNTLTGNSGVTPSVSGKLQQENNQMRQDIDNLRKLVDKERQSGRQNRENLVTLFKYLRLPYLGKVDSANIDSVLAKLVAMVQKSDQGYQLGSKLESEKESSRRNQIIQQVLIEYERQKG